MKRLWKNILILFGCFLLLVTTLGAVLIISPGMELLGVMYIRSTSGSVNASKSISNATEFEKITIESDNIPVYIEFVQSYSLKIDLVEKYNGFAHAGDEPYFEVETTATEISVRSYEYKPFLGYSRDEESGLYIKVPMYYTNDIVVNSNKSRVGFSGQTARLGDITINAKGNITLANNMEIGTLTLNIGNKDAVISDGVEMSGNLVATSKRGNLTLPAGFSGRAEVTTTTGDLKCAGCGQLIFNSKTGKVKGTALGNPIITDDADINTNGDVTIESVGGSAHINAGNGKVTLGKSGIIFDRRVDIITKIGKVNLLGTFTNMESSITTKYGAINAEVLQNMKISSTYGKITATELTGCVVETKSGDVTTSRIANSTITTKRGDVTIGGENSFDGGATITTTSGDVEIVRAGETHFVVTTKSGDVSFDQNTDKKSELTITSEKGEVSLTNINGKTNVSTTKKITATIYNLNNSVVLVGKNKDVTVTVRSSCYMDLSSSKEITTAPGLEEETKIFCNIPAGEDKYLKIETKKGKIAVFVA